MFAKVVFGIEKFVVIVLSLIPSTLTAFGIVDAEQAIALTTALAPVLAWLTANSRPGDAMPSQAALAEFAAND